MSIVVKVNGEELQLPDGIALAELVRQLDERPGGRGVAVALAGEVVPRAAWATTKLTEGAVVELVVAVQGG